MIKIKKREDYIKYLHLEYADTGDPADLTGCSVYSQMRDVPGGTLLATAVCTMEAETGDIHVKYSGSDTEDLPLGEAGYDVWIVENGMKHPIYTTRVTIIDAYTKDFGE